MTIHEAYTVKSSVADGRHDLLNGSGWFEMPGYIPRVWGKPKKKKNEKKNNEVTEEEEEDEGESEEVTVGKGRPTQQEQELELLDRYDEAAQELAVLIRDLGQGMQCLKGEVERMKVLATGLEDVAFAAAAAATASSDNMAKDETAVGMMDRERQQQRQLDTGPTTTTFTSTGGSDDADIDNNGKEIHADNITDRSPPLSQRCHSHPPSSSSSSRQAG